MNPFKKIIPVNEEYIFESKNVDNKEKEHKKEIQKFTKLGYRTAQAEELLKKYKSFDKFDQAVGKIEVDGVDTPKEIYEFLTGKMAKKLGNAEMKQRSETYKKKFQKM